MIKKILALWVSLFILLGMVVVYYWRDTHYQPQQGEMFYYFLILPALITLILILPYLIYLTYQKYQSNKQKNILQSQQDAVESAPVIEDVPLLKLNVYTSGAYSALGENEQILTGITEFTSAQLDQQLCNEWGELILSYRIVELDQHINTDVMDVQISGRLPRIMALLDQQLMQHTAFLTTLAAHLKQSSLFYESQNMHEYRMHPAWIDPAFQGDENSESQPVTAVYRIDKLNVVILLSEDLLHIWDEQYSNEHIYAALYDLEIIPQKIQIEYHFLNSVTTIDNVNTLLGHIHQQAHIVTLMIVVDSEIAQEILDTKVRELKSYIPAEFVASCVLAHPDLQLEQLQPLKTLIFDVGQSSVNPLLQQLKLQDLPQYQDKAPFVVMNEDVTDIQVAKKINQFFAESPIEQHHYLYVQPSTGHSQNVAKVFGMVLGMQFSHPSTVLVYTQDLKLFIQDFDQSSLIVASTPNN